MLAMIGWGEYGAAIDLDSIEVQMNKLFSKGVSTVLANITIDAFDDREEIDPFQFRFPSDLGFFTMSLTLPDLSLESPLTIHGRYQGSFPDNLKAKGILGDLSSFTMDLKIQRAKDIPFDSEKYILVPKLSILTCNISRNKMLFWSLEEEGDPHRILDSEQPELILLQRLSVGFVDLIATAENIPPGSQEPELPQNSIFTENG
ncbi:von Willebrand factor A domain-containing [Gossypium australe]|uniref:von Willebrand factor A domain-containing n=1 Tax=Gossypium australe TaxID=47621 RepID=A0A5B6WXJ3_9ROSI|nr:von Willebrand factor A domain-containing [Gossypium australe]